MQTAPIGQVVIVESLREYPEDLQIILNYNVTRSKRMTRISHVILLMQTAGYGAPRYLNNFNSVASISSSGEQVFERGCSRFQ